MPASRSRKVNSKFRKPTSKPHQSFGRSKRADKTFVVRHETDLLSFVKEKLTGQSERNVRRIIANHQVAVGGAPVSLFSFRLYPEDEVTLAWEPIRKKKRKDLPIIYEDEHLIAIDKPSGLLSVASDKEKKSTAYRMMSDYVTMNNRSARLFVVHRLDEDTSGVLVFAKDRPTQEKLQKHWNDVVTKRGYYAIVEGSMEKKEATLKDYLFEDKTNLMRVAHGPRGAKLAVTNYKVMAEKGGFSLLDVDIKTGRKNQIRVQLGHTGHFVIGDDKYGEPANPLKRLGLHAYQLTLISPEDGRKIDLRSPMPYPFKKMFFNVEKEESRERKDKDGKK